MPRSKRNAPTSPAGANTMPEFVNCQLSEEEKVFVKSNIPPLKELIEKIEELASDNYKITISFDDTTDCYAVYMIGKPNQVRNPNLMLSAYAPVLAGALTMLFYKHFTAMKEEWSRMSQANNANSWR